MTAQALGVRQVVDNFSDYDDSDDDDGGDDADGYDDDTDDDDDEVDGFLTQRGSIFLPHVCHLWQDGQDGGR